MLGIGAVLYSDIEHPVSDYIMNQAISWMNGP